MNKSVGIAAAVGIVIIIGVIGFQINETTYQRSSVDEYKEDQIEHKECGLSREPTIFTWIKN